MPKIIEFPPALPEKPGVFVPLRQQGTRSEEYEVSIFREISSDSDDPLTKYELVQHFPASQRRVSKLSWTYSRPGGCDELRCELLLPFDAFGLDFRTRTVQHFHHLTLTVRGRRWWCGAIESIAPKLAIPEMVTITARGYAKQAERANLSWSFARQQIKTAGDIGEIPGIVRAMWLFVPLLFGTQDGFPNPLADSIYLVGSSARPRGLVLDNVSIWELFDEVAALAGNYDWGVDEYRRLYFTPPQEMTEGTALYTTDSAQNVWSIDPDVEGYGTYGDETYHDPDPTIDGLPVEEHGTLVIGSQVITIDASDSVQGSKNVLQIIAAPKRPGDQPHIFTVSSPEWLDFWRRRLTTKIATSFFAEEADVRRWGERQLRLLGPPQTQGAVRGTYQSAFPIHPVGAVRIIDPNAGIDVKHRVQRVAYAYEQDDHLVVQVDLAYQPPPDQYFAEQLRRDATLAQNSLVGERTPFILAERMRWYTDTWTAELNDL